MKYRILLVLSVLFFSFTTMAQKNWTEYKVENVSIKAPEGWQAKISENQPGGAYSMTIKKANTECFVELTCLKRIMTPNTRMQDIATMRSQQANFEYMQIDKTESTKFQKNNARLLSYTNTYRNDVCKGGIYCFNAEGFTYTIEYFGEDNPEVRKMLDKIVNTFKYTSPDKERNIVEQEKDYQIQLEPIEIQEKFAHEDDAKFYKIVMSSRLVDDTYLVTGNIRHFPERDFVVTPAQMIDIINKNC